MKRLVTLLLAAVMMLALVVPGASAQADSTPNVGTPVASPMASPEAGGFVEGETDYMRGTSMITITLTELDEDVVGSENVEEFDPESNTNGTGFTFEEELDAPEGCRLIHYSVEGVPLYPNIYAGLCSNNDWGLLVIASDQEAIEHVLTQFSDGETDLVPEGYNERD